MQADHRHSVVGYALLKTLAYCHTDHIFSDVKPVILFLIAFLFATSWVFTIVTSFKLCEENLANMAIIRKLICHTRFILRILAFCYDFKTLYSVVL